MDFLTKIWSEISHFATQYVITPILNIGIWDAVDILLLAVILYQLYRFTRNRRAGRVVFGLVAVVIVSTIITSLKLPTLNFIVRLFSAAAFFSIVVIFQPEIRDLLEQIGNLTLFNPRSNTIPKKRMDQARAVADETADAVEKMAGSRTGALIVFEGLTKLGEYVETGKIVDARVSSKLLQNLFYNGAPLHDGALIIRDMRIWAASCVLPSTKSKMNFGTMGTRHRAAVGITEVSDALVIVVSEQTGIVSVAQDGKLLRDVDGKTLRDILMTYIAGNAYLRLKRANMRKEYLEMLENVARVKTPAEPRKSSREEIVEKEFQKLIGQDEPTEETDSSIDSVEVIQAPRADGSESTTDEEQNG
ncbi:MAG: TIGR00159 family protein [Ruminococcaceae bacterium]|nr:TIGR00159 family protein [Oscillospiraceae bacterium]